MYDILPPIIDINFSLIGWREVNGKSITKFVLNTDEIRFICSFACLVVSFFNSGVWFCKYYLTTLICCLTRKRKLDKFSESCFCYSPAAAHIELRDFFAFQNQTLYTILANIYRNRYSLRPRFKKPCRVLHISLGWIRLKSPWYYWRPATKWRRQWASKERPFEDETAPSSQNRTVHIFSLAKICVSLSCGGRKTKSNV